MNAHYGERVLDLYAGIADRSTCADKREELAVDLIADVLASLVPHYVADANAALAVGRMALDWYSDEAYDPDGDEMLDDFLRNKEAEEVMRGVRP